MGSERQAFNDGFDKGLSNAQERITQLEADLAEAKWENEVLEEAIKTALDTPLGEPMGIIKRQVLHDALKFDALQSAEEQQI